MKLQLENKKVLLEAVQELRESSGHSIMTEEWGQKVASAFGVEAPVHTFKPSKTDPKGVMPNWNEELKNGEGDWDYTPFTGVYALSLLSNIVRHLGLETRGFFGRGSQYRADLEKVTEYVEGLE